MLPLLIRPRHLRQRLARRNGTISAIGVKGAYATCPYAEGDGQQWVLWPYCLQRFHFFHGGRPSLAVLLLPLLPLVPREFFLPMQSVH
jgi:hypothetical protein